MAVNLSMLAGAGAQFFTDSGVILSGGLVYTYAAGTTTPQTTYTTSAGNVAHTNPIVLNSAGRVASGGEIWLTDAVSYKFVLQTSTAVTIATYDNVTGNSSGIYAAFAASSGSSLVGYTQGGTGAVATTVQAKLRESVSILDFGALTSNTAVQNTTAINAAIQAGNNIYIPSGTYACNTLTLRSGVCLYGDGASSLLSFPNGQTGLSGTAAAPGSYLEDITLSNFKCLGAVGTSGFSEFVHLVNVNGVKNFLVDQMQITGFQGDGIYLGDGGTTLHNVGVKITRCLFDGVNSDNRNGISVIDGADVLIDGNRFVNCTKSTMPAMIDVEPNFITDIVQNIKITNNYFGNNSAAEGAICVAITPTLTTPPSGFVIANNTFEHATQVSINVYVANNYSTGTDLSVSGNTFNCLMPWRVYPNLRNATFSGNAVRSNGGNFLLGFNATDVLYNIAVTGNSFLGNGSGRLGTIPGCSGFVFSSNTINGYADYGLLVGGVGGSVTNFSVVNNAFNGITGAGYSIGTNSATSIDGATCLYLGNIGNLLGHEFNAWRTDDTGIVTNNTTAVSFNSATLPASFPKGISIANINGDTGVPSTGGYQGTLTCYHTGYNSTKYTYQNYYPANNTTDLGSFYIRKADVTANSWTAWYKVTGV